MSEYEYSDLNGKKLSPIDRVIRYCLNNKLIVTIIMLIVIGWGIMVAPFDWKLGHLSRDPVPVDAIPDIGENQQIVFTKWMGRSPQDVEDQITYPLTVSLLGIPGVKTIRSYSYFGFSTIYVIFKDDVEFYWSRSRVLEKLNSLRAARFRRMFNPLSGLTLQLWGRFSGTRLRDAISMATPLEDGTCMNCGRYRITRFATRCSLLMAWPRWPRSAVIFKSTRLMSTPAL